MVYRIHIYSKIPDTRAQVLLHKLWGLGFADKVTGVDLIDVYTIEKVLNEKQVELIGEMLANPVMQGWTLSLDRQTPVPCSFALEIGFLPGVTDNVAHTVKEGIADLFKTSFGEEEGVYSSQLILLSGPITKDEVRLVADLLANPLIQRTHIKSRVEFDASGGMDAVVPRVTLKTQPGIDLVDLALSDDQLVPLGLAGIANADGTRRGPLALSLADLKAIQAYFKGLGRQPTDVELEMLAQTWSEHCKHTIFASPLDEIKEGLYKHFIKAATNVVRRNLGKRDFCVSVFKDNSGAVVFDDNWLVTHKVETHNSPSALDPYGGAITGIVGVNRDTVGFGKGAKPVANIYGYCFGNPFDERPLYRDKEKTNPMLSPQRILSGVVAGVKDGGNQSGIPTPQGFCYFDDGYRGKPLVFVGTVGLIPRTVAGLPAHEKKANPGDLIVMVGGRVGKDGIHGATFSSEALTQGSPVSAVQIGDAITQKKFSDVIVKEARELGLYSSITDNGAGGLSSSLGEMANESGGCEVWLDRVPLKYPGLAPWEIWISESQERMSLAVPPSHCDALLSLCKRRGVEATVIGCFTDSGRCVVKYHEQVAVDLDLNFLHEGQPKKEQVSAPWVQTHAEPVFDCPADITKALLQLVKSPNCCDHSFVTYQYDHEVQASSVLKPLQGLGRVFAPATITRPVLTQKKGVVLSQALFPAYGSIDCYAMAACAIDAAIGHVVAAGADPERVALLDNFCWCDALSPERLGQLKKAARACHDHSIAFGAPFVSGKDSMFNDFRGYDENGPVSISIPPTLLISSLGVIDDITKALSLDVKLPGDLVYVLGETRAELGGSAYYAGLQAQNGEGFVGNSVPRFGPFAAGDLYKALAKAIADQRVASALCPGLGGLGVAFAKMAVGGQKGLNIDLAKVPGVDKITRDDHVLFSQSAARVVVTVAPKNRLAFESLFADLPFCCVGEVGEDDLFEIKGLDGRVVVSSTIQALTAAYRQTFKGW